MHPFVSATTFAQAGSAWAVLPIIHLLIRMASGVRTIGDESVFSVLASAIVPAERLTAPTQAVNITPAIRAYHQTINRFHVKFLSLTKRQANLPAPISAGRQVSPKSGCDIFLQAVFYSIALPTKWEDRLEHQSSMCLLKVTCPRRLPHNSPIIF